MMLLQKVFISWVTLIGGIFPTMVMAQSLKLNEDCDIQHSDQFQPGMIVKTQGIERDLISARHPSQTEMTTPSLWWAAKQFDSPKNRLITTWQANRNTKIIDLIVNHRVWRKLDNRYSFVNKMGTVARDYQYNLRVINEQQNCLAIYSCDFTVTPNQCNLELLRN